MYITTIFVLILIVSLIACTGIFLVFRRLRRAPGGSFALEQVQAYFDAQKQALSSLQTTLREEFGLNRTETNAAFRGLREEVNGQISSLLTSNEQKFELLRQSIEQRLNAFQADTGVRLDAVAMNVSLSSKELSETVGLKFTALGESVNRSLLETHKAQKTHVEALVSASTDLAVRLQEGQTRFSSGVDTKFTSLQETINASLLKLRSDLSTSSQSHREETGSDNVRRIAAEKRAGYCAIPEDGIGAATCRCRPTGCRRSKLRIPKSWSRCGRRSMKSCKALSKHDWANLSSR